MTINSSATITNNGLLAFTNSMIAGTGLVTNNGLLAFTNSTITGAGLLTNKGTMTVISSTINTALQNQGSLTVQPGNSFFNSVFTNENGALLWLQGTGFPSQLIIANGFNNDGKILMTTRATLTVTNGTLVNADTIQVSNAVGPLTIDAQIDNQGIIIVETGLQVLNNGSTFTSTNGTLDIEAGQKMEIKNGNTVLGSGTVFQGEGIVSLMDTQTLTLQSDLILEGEQEKLTFDGVVTVEGPGSLINNGTLTLNSETINTVLQNRGSLTVRPGDTFFNSVFTNENGALLWLQGTGFPSQLIIANGFNNDGKILMTTRATLTVTNGTLVNADTIQVSNAVGLLTIDAQIDNQGIIIVETELRVLNNGSTFTSTNGTLDIEAGQKMEIKNGNTVLGSGTVFQGEGALSLMDTQTLTLQSDLILEGEQEQLTFDGVVTVEGPGSLINNGTLTLNSETINTALRNRGSLTVRPGDTFFNSVFTNENGALLWVLGEGNSTSQLIIANGFNNDGKILMTTRATLTVTNGTLVNADTIQVSNGGGVPLTIDAQIDNQGIIIVDTDLGLDKTSASHVNRGIVRINGSTLTVSQLVAESPLINVGTIDINGGTFKITSGIFENKSKGILQGNGTLDIASAMFINEGDINPGTPTGVFRITGKYNSSSTAQINIDLSTGGFDQVSISDSAEFNGILNIRVDGFVPTIGNTFPILVYGELKKGFDQANILGTALGNGIILKPEYTNPNTLSLVTINIGPLDAVPVAINFGEVIVNETVFDTLTLANIGTSNLNVGPFSLMGSNPENFSIGTNQFILSPQQDTSLVISFGPDTSGSFNAFLEIVSDSNTINVNLSGIGIEPRPPNKPSLRAPAEDAILDDSTPTLIFTIPADPNDDSLHFKVEIDDASDFSVGVLTFDSRQSTTGFSPAPPVPQGSGQMSYTLQSPLSDRDWWWRITAIDELDSMSTSDARRFTIDTGAATEEQFTRITEGDIVNDGGRSVGVSWADYDNDGNLDLFVTNESSVDNTNFLYRNIGDGSFEKISFGNIVNDGSDSKSSSWGDFDNDGDLDLFVANRTAEVLDSLYNSFYENNGDGFFTKITRGSIVSDAGLFLGSSWADYDNDGNLDLYVTHGFSGNNILYKNTGNGDFLRITEGDIVNDGDFSSNCSWGDYDNDGDLDLFVPNAGGNNNFLYRNEGDATFKRMTQLEVGSIVDDAGNSKGSSWADFDNDGDLDLFVANGVGTGSGENNFLYQNNGNGSFTRISNGIIVEDGGISRGSSWVDYDNDGFLDLFVTNDFGESNFLYQNNKDGTFTKIITGSIVTDFSNSQACGWGDYDNDGDLDLYVSNGSSENNFLYQNNGNNNKWINIKCIGTASNWAAIGTKIRAKAVINGTPIWQLQEISGQTGLFSQNSLNVEFGLGDATTIDSIKVEWPSGIEQVLTNVAANQFLTITESEQTDLVPPQVSHSPILTSSTGQSQIISAMLIDDGGIFSATLFYRQGGASPFASTNMTNTSGNTWEGTIPASFIAEQGTEYYFSTQDQTGNISTFPSSNPQNNPQVIQVTSSNLPFNTQTPNLAYRMISVPIELDNESPAAVLEDDLGLYDTKQWRLYKSINGTKREYTVDNIGNFDPGVGFWLITRGAKSLDTGSGKSVTTAQNFVITLQSGWNQIGNPFAFPVSWNDVVKNGNVEDMLVGYQGTGYDFTRTQLIPFEGYFVNNLASSTTTIEIPAKSATGTEEQSADLRQLFNLQSEEWALQLTAQSDRFLDKDNYIGVLSNTSDTWDRRDFSEAPFFDSYVSLYFPHDDWQIYPGRYTGDFRSQNASGHLWDFRVKSNIPNAEVVLTLADLENVPSTWNITLLDKSGKTSIDLLAQNTYSFPAGEHGTERDFRILVGNSDFTDNHDLGFSGVPEEFVLSQNYPNPFNPETHIDYELPSESNVKIAVYNLRGQRVRTLFNAKQSAGRYTVSWDGRSEDALFVASGVYLVRIEAGNFVATRKVILTK